MMENQTEDQIEKQMDSQMEMKWEATILLVFGVWGHKFLIDHWRIRWNRESNMTWKVSFRGV